MIYWWYMNKYQQKHIITLSSREQRELQDITRKGKHSVRVTKRAQVLLKSYHGQKDTDIADSVEMTVRTVENIRARFAEGGVKRALYDTSRSGHPPVLDDNAEAHLVAISCSDPPCRRGMLRVC